jgi:hypothetical protein
MKIYNDRLRNENPCFDWIESQNTFKLLRLNDDLFMFQFPCRKKTCEGSRVFFIKEKMSATQRRGMKKGYK